jgi:hypothetical protein
LTVKLYKYVKKSAIYTGGFLRRGPVTAPSMLIISVNMKYEKSRNEVAIFAGLLFEKEVKRKQEELLLLNVRFQALKDVKDKKIHFISTKSVVTKGT